MTRLFYVLWAVTFFFFKTNAQGLSAFNNGSVGVSSSLEPERNFRDSSGGYRYSAISMNARLPLFVHHSIATGKFYQASLHADFQSGTASFGFINQSRTFVNGNFGLGMMLYNGGKNLILINAAMGMAADENVISKGNTRYRFSGSFIINHQHSAGTIYQYGAALTYAYGNPLLLPVLGIRTRLSPKWTLTSILPAEISFINRINVKTGLSFSLRPAGNRFQFDNQANFATASNTVFWQLREFQLGSAVYYKFSGNFTATCDIGFLVGGKLRFTEQEEPRTILYETVLKPGAMFRFSIRYRLPNKKGMHTGNMQDLLNPLGN